MKNLAFIILFMLFCYYAAKSQSEKLISTSIDRLKKDVYVLASDSMEGRKSTLSGQKKAAKYISDQFEKAGLKPICGNTFYQTILLQSYQYGKSFIHIGSKIKSSGTHFAFASTKASKYTKELAVKFIGYSSIKNLKPGDFGDTIMYLLDKDLESAIKRINYLSSTYKAHYFAISLPKGKKQCSNIIEAENHKNEDVYPSTTFNFMNPTYTPLYKYFTDTTLNISVWLFDDQLFEEMYSENLMDVHTHCKKQQKKGKLPEMNSLNIKAEIDFYFVSNQKTTENVIGIIEGSGSQGECVVIGAHFDHEGIRAGKTYYGADDNASGTAALMELARFFGEEVKNGNIPLRTLVFIAFTAEEVGLNGSAFYVKNPVIPLKKTAYMINMDMIGRGDENHANKPNFVYIKAMGNYKHKIKKINMQFDKTLPEIYVDKTPAFWLGFLYRMGSDHFSFIRQKVPAIVYFTGLHNDYHTPRDTPDKINYSNMANIVKLVFSTTSCIANDEKIFRIKN